MSKHEWVNHLTGEINECASLEDALINEFESLKQLESNVRDRKRLVEEKLVDMASTVETSSKTIHIQGEKRNCKVVFTARSSWDKDKLNEIKKNIGSEKFYRFFEPVGYKGKAAELKKLSATAGEAQDLFKKFSSAKVEAYSKPQIKVDA